MFDVLFDTSTPFKAFTSLHWIPLALFAIVLTSIILYSRKKLNSQAQTNLGFAIALIPLFCVVVRMLFTGIEGKFSVQEELPLHLCRLLAFIMPWVMLKRNRKWFGITYFLIIVGTLQALLTPDLPLGPTHYSYYLYWTLHSVLIALPLYCLFVYKFTITWKDFKNSVIVGNLYMLSTLFFNWLLGSNYFYTAHKPPSPTLLDVLGPWPWYLFVVEGIALVLYTIAFLPFLFKKKKSQA